MLKKYKNNLFFFTSAASIILLTLLRGWKKRLLTLILILLCCSFLSSKKAFGAASCSCDPDIQPNTGGNVSFCTTSGFALPEPGFAWSATSGLSLSGGAGNGCNDFGGISYCSVSVRPGFPPSVQTVTVTRGAQSASCNITTYDPGPPPVTCSPASQSASTGQTVSFSAAGGSGSFSWSAPGGSPASGNGSSFNTSFGSSGSKTITVTSGTDNASCSVNVATPPIFCSPSSQNVVVGQAASLSASGGNGPGSYTWSAPGGSPSSASGPAVFTTTYSATGTQTVTLTSGAQNDTCTVNVGASPCGDTICAFPAETCVNCPGDCGACDPNNVTLYIYQNGAVGSLAKNYDASVTGPGAQTGTPSMWVTANTGTHTGRIESVAGNTVTLDVCQQYGINDDHCWTSWSGVFPSTPDGGCNATECIQSFAYNNPTNTIATTVIRFNFTGSGPTCGANGCEVGEDCVSCPGDCGACPVLCPDGSCNGGETCSTCPQDCGTCTCSGPFGPFAWTDNPLVPGVTPIRVIHINEMMNRIDTLRADAGLPVFNWAQYELPVTTQTPISNRHVNAFRTALREVFQTCGDMPAWNSIISSPPMISTDSPIRSSYIQQLRTAIDTAK